MQQITTSASENRPLTADERQLLGWMLENGTAQAKAYLPQLEWVRVANWRCPCGCASINFTIGGSDNPTGSIHPIADFVFGSEAELSGIFVFEQSGVLGGIEVYGLAGDAPKSLPSIEQLRSLGDLAK